MSSVNDVNEDAHMAADENELSPENRNGTGGGEEREILSADEFIESAPTESATEEPEPPSGESIEQPGKVMRVGAMVRQLLEEIRGTEMDELSRERLKDIYETSITELGSALSPELHQELVRLSSPFDDTTPTDSELLVAKAQLVGWLEGLIQGIQAMLFAQQAQAQAQLANMRAQLPPGMPQTSPNQTAPSENDRPGGTYL